MQGLTASDHYAMMTTLFTQTMHESTLDLFCDHDDEQMAHEFAIELETKAAELEVTVDYYLMEFM
ncbi:hypothetical protein [Synechococcus phage DSL-LC03]|nr:hypothetical protein [Synechococcus phage DSL-LC03]